MGVNVFPYKKSIHDSWLPREQISIIWDFYVTKSVAKSCSQKRGAHDYGLNSLPIKGMLIKVGFNENNNKILMCDSIKKTLEKLDLNTGTVKEPVLIDVNSPRMACIRNYQIEDEE